MKTSFVMVLLCAVGGCAGTQHALATASTPERPVSSPAPSMTAVFPTVAFVDMRRAIDSTEDGKRAIEELKQDLDAKQKELAQANAEIEKDKKAKPAVLSEKKAKRDQLSQRLQREYNAKEQAHLQRLFTRMQQVVERMAKQKGVMILPIQVAIYAPPGCDLTDEAVLSWGRMEIDTLKAKISELEKK
jgi:Skp family chaperone for outer membrane proteins